LRSAAASIDVAYFFQFKPMVHSFRVPMVRRGHFDPTTGRLGVRATTSRKNETSNDEQSSGSWSTDPAEIMAQLPNLRLASAIVSMYLKFNFVVDSSGALNESRISRNDSHQHSWRESCRVACGEWFDRFKPKRSSPPCSSSTCDLVVVRKGS
jgi:hypothetical protein